MSDGWGFAIFLTALWLAAWWPVIRSIKRHSDGEA